MTYTYIIESYDNTILDDFYTEKVGDTILKIISSINDMVKNMVENFNNMIQKHKIDKTIKELEKLDQNLSVESNIDLKETSKTYSSLINGYKNVVDNPEKDSNLNVIVVKANEDRKKIFLKKGITVTVTVSALLGYLFLLKNKNDYKNYKIFEIKSDVIDSSNKAEKNIKASLMSGMKNKYTASNSKTKDEYLSAVKEIEKSKKNAISEMKKIETMKTNAKESIKALQESEYYRLKLYLNVRKMAESILKNVEGTIKYGIKGIGVPKNLDPSVDSKYQNLKDESIKNYTYALSKLKTPKYNNGSDDSVIKKISDKVMSPESKSTEEIRKRFEREKRLYQMKKERNK